MSAKVKIMLVAFISLISFTALSFAEDIQPQTATAGSGTVNATVKPAKVKKEKKQKKVKKTKQEAKKK